MLALKTSFPKTLAAISDAPSVMAQFTNFLEDTGADLSYFPMWIRNAVKDPLVLTWAKYEAILWRWKTTEISQSFEPGLLFCDPTLELLAVDVSDFELKPGLWGGIKGKGFFRLTREDAKVIDVLGGHHPERKYTKAQLLSQLELDDAHHPWPQHLESMLERQILVLGL